MKIITCSLTLAFCLAAGPALAQQGQPFREDIETRYVGAGKTAGVFIGRVYGSSPKVTSTVWTFMRAPLKYRETPYNTAAAVAEIDCAARTLKRTTITVLQGEMFGQDRVSRVVGKETVTEAATPYAAGTIFGEVIAQACKTGPVDDKTNPTFQTLSQARAFGFYMAGEAGK